MHEIQTVFHEAKSLQDRIEIFGTKENDKTSIVNHPKNSLIKMGDNLAHRALKLIKKACKCEKNVHIEIQKNIPISSGLGGASSNAAAVLKGLNDFWGLNLGTEKLLDLAKELGADVPFFIIGGTALGTGTGENLKPLTPIMCLQFKINPKSSSIENKTATQYQQIDLAKCAKNLDKTEKLLHAIEEENPQKIIENLHNDFETLPEYSNLSPSHLSGAGPSTFTAVLA